MKTAKIKVDEGTLRSVWHQFAQMDDYVKEPRVIVEGEGAIVRDIDGKEYIDGQSGMYVTAVGHGREEIADAVAEQMKTLEYFGLFEYTTLPAVELAQKLSAISPGRLSTVCYGVCGSEAVEIAVKISRQYQTLRGFKKRYKVVARRYAYHGVTMGALSALGIPALREAFEPLVPGFRHITHPNCYRCELGLEYPECGVACARELENLLRFEVPETVAAFIGEPVSVAHAVMIPPKEYWPMIRDICSEHGVVLIADEVITGFGRTGRLFGCEHWGLEPDMLLFAKGVTSGYMPLAGALLIPEIPDAFRGGMKEAFMHGGTYSGHPAGCVAALTNIDILEREKLVERSARLGDYLLRRAEELYRHPIVGHVCGLGLLVGLELVVDRDKKTPVPVEVSRFVRRRTWELGLIYRYRNTGINLAPPLTVTEAQLERALEILDQVLTETEREYLS